MILSLPEYIDRLIGLVPPEQGRLLAGLKSARQSALFTPPEYWHEIRQDVLVLVDRWAVGDEPWVQPVKTVVAEDLAAWNAIAQKRGGEAAA